MKHLFLFLSLVLTLSISSLQAQTGSIGYSYTQSAPVGLYGTYFSTDSNIGGIVSFSTSLGQTAQLVSNPTGLGNSNSTHTDHFNISAGPVYSLPGTLDKVLVGIAVGFRGAENHNVYQDSFGSKYFESNGVNISPTISPMVIINSSDHPFSLKVGYTIVSSTKDSIAPHSLDVGLGFSF